MATIRPYIISKTGELVSICVNITSVITSKSLHTLQLVNVKALNKFNVS